ncbi:exopolysaccharide biosynthesis GT4 family glycosyltransferase EpsE [Paenarthrobacter aurescens]|uniref:Colanic acid biosynthesis glycosyltransferase WcaL n=1 Tax=Paenarthrobacter aurescens TaxID=43663 RepID=A0A4Y3NFK7_PAEAU|nr:exopolysaccharide biosynthesis GT4 family glycosyltransferase EpsE [Paenarthrobacter aurescens]MDO6143606.1 glycosyltransferase family 4 protein [Paenarthrobacter aurescens]MDO6147454.1 glycosyltransferase family 4 protein [Paenarthrobacter aurescens]MDO6158698.1 glycosyltransferase family 4 protein [Paenarthrobacter aurescens]MDO6162681.1 glycosyltransferase family 4 protein [Paenarthrobacter aurescens]GEB19255.1 colanic acid biosynthesis glycosyltransferase WcaL [Paenarthrobacter aurescen
MTRFGYLVPEFPGQTHSFFWRELKALTELGYQPEPVSTRRPKQPGTIPPWAQDRLPEIHYLVPPGLAEIRSTATTALPGLRHPGTLAAASGLLPRPTTDMVRPRDVLRTAGLFWAGAALARHARTRGWSHIHVHSCAQAAQAALFAHMLSGITYSLTLHGPLSDYGPNQQQKWLNAKFSVVITERLLAETLPQLDGFMPTDVSVAPMGVELSDFTRATPYVPWGGAGPARLFCCARLNPSKGHKELLTAVRLISETGIEVQLTIAGEDDAGGKGYRATLENFIRELDLTQKVRLLGAVPEDRIKEELEKAHIFTLASHQEPLGVAIMEAMAMEVPVVATSAGGVPDLITTGHSGTLVDPGNPSSLAKAILHHLHNPSHSTATGQRARKALEEKFDVTKSARIVAARL